MRDFLTFMKWLLLGLFWIWFSLAPPLILIGYCVNYLLSPVALFAALTAIIIWIAMCAWPFAVFMEKHGISLGPSMPPPPPVIPYREWKDDR